MLVLLRSPVGLAMTFMNAFFLQRAFNAVAADDGTALNAACLAFLAVSACVFIYNGSVWSACAAPLVVKLEGRLRMLLFDKISSLPYKRFETAQTGEWMTRLNIDVQTPYNEVLPHIASAVLNIGVFAIIIYLMDPAVLGWILLFVIPHILFSQLFIARRMPELNKRSLEAAGNNTDELNTLLISSDISALYDAGEYFMERFKISSDDLFKANMRIRILNALSAGILPLFGIGGYLALLIIGAGWISDGHMTFGDLTAAFQYRGGVLVGSLTLINCLVALQSNMAGIRRLNSLMAEETVH